MQNVGFLMTRLIYVKLKFFYKLTYLASLCGCTAKFVSDLVGNLEDSISHDAAHMILVQSNFYKVNCNCVQFLRGVLNISFQSQKVN